MKKISNSERLKLAQRFFENVWNQIEEGTDFIYEMIDPDCEYDGDELCKEFNYDTILEVLRIGFLWKYGEDLKCENIKNRTKKVCDRMNKKVETIRFLRNCDVGSAAAQMDRFVGFCSSHKPFCIDCPLKGKGVCGILWAQMPFGKKKAKCLNKFA